MKTKWGAVPGPLGLGVLAVLLAVALVVPAAASGSSGRMLVTSSTILSEDHYGDIFVGANAVTLDCAGHAVIGSGSFGAGIFAYGRSEITIQNCRVSGFRVGISVVFGSNNSVLGNTATASSVGIALGGESSDLVAGNTARDNALNGIEVSGVADTMFSDNVVVRNQTGFYVTPTGWTGQASIRNTFLRNAAQENEDDGFLLGDPRSTELVENRSTSNGADGFVLLKWLDGPISNSLRGNVSTGNGSSGFALSEGSGDTLSENESSGNIVGFYVVASSGETLDHNVAFDNYAGIGVADSSGNTLSHNRSSNNSLGFYITRSSGETIAHNIVVNNQEFGFRLYNVGDSSLTHNVSKNNNVGFALWDSTGSTLAKNVANENRRWGFQMGLGSSGNLVEQCVARENGYADAFDMTPAGANTWLRNSFGSISIS